MITATQNGNTVRVKGIIHGAEWESWYLFNICYGYDDHHFLVRAESIYDAADLLVESKHGVCLRIDDEDLPDYMCDNCKTSKQEWSEDCTGDNYLITGQRIPWCSDNLNWGSESPVTINFFAKELPV